MPILKLGPEVNNSMTLNDCHDVMTKHYYCVCTQFGGVGSSSGESSIQSPFPIHIRFINGQVEQQQQYEPDTR